MLYAVHISRFFRMYMPIWISLAAPWQNYTDVVRKKDDGILIPDAISSLVSCLLYPSTGVQLALTDIRVQEALLTGKQNLKI